MEHAVDARTMRKVDMKGRRWLWSFIRAGRAAALVALLLAVGTAPALAQSPEGKDLRGFYMQHCAVCHGPDGSAVDAEGKRLKGRDFTNQEWQRGARDEQMVKIILKGKFFGLAMPAFKDALTPQEAQQMVTEIIRKSQKGQVIAPAAKGTGGK
jgi:mono/diheme cytochrome c family protein